MTIKVSILIPTFNQDPRILKECVDSALDQTYENMEIIISDNHSSNGTEELLKKYNDSRLKVVKPKSFLPMIDNFAFCAQHARGEYISFLSSDDVLLPSAIQKLYEALERHASAVFACGNIYSARSLPAQRHSSLIRPIVSESEVVYSSKQAEDFFFPWKMASTWMAGDLIRRDAYERTGGFGASNMRAAGDVWLTRALLMQGDFVCLSDPLALFRTRAIFSKEVDRDRRLLNFMDGIIISSEEKSNISITKKIYQYILLAYRLGADPRPSKDTISKVWQVFDKQGRSDLAFIVSIDGSHNKLFRMFGMAFRAMEIFKRLLRIGS